MFVQKGWKNLRACHYADSAFWIFTQAPFHGILTLPQHYLIAISTSLSSIIHQSKKGRAISGVATRGNHWNSIRPSRPQKTCATPQCYDTCSSCHFCWFQQVLVSLMQKSWSFCVFWGLLAEKNQPTWNNELLMGKTPFIFSSCDLGVRTPGKMLWMAEFLKK